MEILIVGVILVALMAYASTRIKKSAAEAYEPETVETADFVIKKPVGFLTVIGGDPKYAFEAYTKDFAEDAPEFRKGTALVTVFDRGDIDQSITGDEITSDISKKIDGRSYRVTEARRRVKDTLLDVYRKSGEANSRIVQLEIVIVKETTEEFVRDIESMLMSFELK